MAYPTTFTSALVPVTPQNMVMRTVLVCDVVDSVCWMKADEASAVQQWQLFDQIVRRQIVPKFGGRIVKSLGDGLMLEFADAPTATHASPQAALNAAFAMQTAARQLDQQGNFSLRMGLNHTAVTVGEDDIYGVGVNLCARIASLAGPGEIIVSAELRDLLTDQLDADLVDMGECYVKHLDEPLRVFRAGPAGAQPIIVPLSEYAAPLQAIVAVVPFAARSVTADEQIAVGEIIADGIIGQLSRTRDLKVISRLSTSVFRNRINTGELNGMADIESYLGANYILSGSYIAVDKKLIVTAELSETKNNHVVWMDRIEGEIGDLLQLQSELCNTIANATHMAIVDTEVQAALIKPLPTLESYSLWLGGISMMHRTSKNSFSKSKEMLEFVNHRHKQVSSTHTWLAKWHLLHTSSGKSTDPALNAKLALDHAQRALELDPQDAHAMAMQGLVLCQRSTDSAASGLLLDQAIALSPNEPVAWLYKSIWSNKWGDSKPALEQAERAYALSPMDPRRYFFEMVLANAYSADFQHDKAIDMAKRSLKVNANHLLTLRVLLLAQAESGRLHDAKQTLATILQVVPDFSISKYRAMDSLDSPGRQRAIISFQQVGLAA